MTFLITLKLIYFHLEQETKLKNFIKLINQIYMNGILKMKDI